MTRHFQVVAAIIGVFVIALAGAGAYFANQSTSSADVSVSRNIAAISLSPVSASANIGESVAIDLGVQPGTGKATLVNLKLSFDSSVIKVDAFNANQVFKGSVQTVIDNEAGKLIVRYGSDSGFKGSQTIGSFRVTAKSTGSTKIVADDEVSPSIVIDGEVRVPIFVGATLSVR